MKLIKQTTKFISTAVLGIGMMLSSTNADAQLSYPYTINFESSTTSPGSKSYASTDPVSLNGVSWVLPGVFLGSPGTAPDKRFDERSARMRLTDNSTGDPGYMYTNEDLTGGVGTLTMWVADYGTEDGSTLTIEYSTDGGTTWTTHTTLSSEEITGELQEFSFEINQPGNVRLKFIKSDGTNNRLNLDNITITNFVDPFSLDILSKSPVGTSVPVATNELTVTFSHPIAAGTGTINVINADDASDVQTFTVPSSAVSITGATATITGLELDNITSYYVTMTAGTFHKSTDSDVENEAITSTTYWTFTTLDESPAPVLTSLDETFADCIGSDITAFFNQYSVTGPRTWNCTSFGHGDENAVRINGGSAEGVSEENADWLISNNPFNVTTLTNPKLTFWMKRRFEGPIDFKVKYSTDYSGTGDPTAATWTDLASITTISELDTWVEATAINLSSISSNFYIAFVYTCGTTGAIELSLDDIRIASTTSVDDASMDASKLVVLGNATTDEIHLQFTTTKSGNYTFQIIDLNGRIVNDFAQTIQAGTQNISLSPLQIRQGMYVIRVIDENGNTVSPVKVIVQ